MRFTRRVYERFQQLIHELAKFGVVGAVAFLVTAVGTNLLHFQAALGPLTANAIATVVATFVSYAGNRYWTFRHREGSGIGREYTVFFVLNGVGLLIQLACIGFAYYVLGQTDKLSYNIALIVGIGLGTLFRFWAYRRWVWRVRQPGEPAAEPVVVPPGAALEPDDHGEADRHDQLDGHGQPGVRFPGAASVGSLGGGPAEAADHLHANGRAVHTPGAVPTVSRRGGSNGSAPGAPRSSRWE